MTTANPNVAANPTNVLSTLQAALQGKTDLFSLIDGGQGFATMLQQFDADQTRESLGHGGAKPARTQSNDDQMASETDDAPSCHDESAAASRPVSKADQPKGSGAQGDKDKVKTDDLTAARGAATGSECTTDAQAAKADADVSAGDNGLETATVVVAADSETPTAATDASDNVPVTDVCAAQAHAPTPVAQRLMPHQMQHAAAKGEKAEADRAAAAAVGQAGDAAPDLANVPPAGTPADNVVAARKNQLQAAATDADAAMPAAAPADDGAPVRPAPPVKQEASHHEESAAGSAGAPPSRDDKSQGGTPTPPLTALYAAFKPVETPVGPTANGNNGAPKLDAAGLRPFETAGKLTQNYDQTAQLTAPKSAKSSLLSKIEVIEQVTVRLNQQAKSGLDQMTIQLRPADLGRVDIRLSFQDGAVTALVTADNQTTLDMLAKDSRSLERALQDAGLRADPGSLSFQLRDSGGQTTAQGERGARGKGDFDLDTPDEILADAGSEEEVYIIEPNRVNLRV